MGTVGGALSGATFLRLFHGVYDGFPGEPTLAFLGIDDIRAVAGGAAVPEPSTWVLMIAGFGLAGAGLRRRRAVFA